MFDPDTPKTIEKPMENQHVRSRHLQKNWKTNGKSTFSIPTPLKPLKDKWKINSIDSDTSKPIEKPMEN